MYFFCFGHEFLKNFGLEPKKKCVAYPQEDFLFIIMHGTPKGHQKRFFFFFIYNKQQTTKQDLRSKDQKTKKEY
jgi:hypothetical protein